MHRNQMPPQMFALYYSGDFETARADGEESCVAGLCVEVGEGAEG
jgi:hypothetical protein